MYTHVRGFFIVTPLLPPNTKNESERKEKQLAGQKKEEGNETCTVINYFKREKDWLALSRKYLEMSKAKASRMLFRTYFSDSSVRPFVFSGIYIISREDFLSTFQKRKVAPSQPKMMFRTSF